jgi:hypothetical protein
MVCFLALVFIRLIQKELNWIYSAEVIKKALNSAGCFEIKKNLFFLKKQNEEFKTIAGLYGIDLNFKWSDCKTIKAQIS